MIRLDDHALARAREAIHPGWSPDLLNRGLAALPAARAARRRRVRAARTIGVAATMLTIFIGWRAITPTERVEPSSAHVEISEPSDLRFGDGTSVRWIGAAGRLTTGALAAEGAVRLEAGSARFSVPRSGRSFVVSAKSVRVSTAGAVFTLRTDGSTVTVSVSEGELVLADAGGGQRTLMAGATVTVAERAERSSPVAMPRPVTRGSLSWRRLAAAGKYDAAYAGIARDRSSVQDDAADLMLAADVARLSGHPRDAIGPLRGVVDRFPRDRLAPVAAFTLGRLLLDELGRPTEAARAFERAHELEPAGALAERALARAVEACRRASDHACLRSAAESYERHYPRGRWLDNVRAARQR